MTRRHHGIAAAAAACALFGAGAGGPGRAGVPPRASDRPSDGRAAPDSVEAVEATPVRLAPVVRAELVLPIVAVGEAARPAVTLVARTSGLVERVNAREGAAVRVGDTLVVLDDREAALDLAQAVAAGEQAEMRFRELSVLDDRVSDGATRAARLAAASVRSGRDVAAVDVARASLALARTRITAPFAGRIAEVRARLGRTVLPGDELLTVIAHAPLRADVRVLETDFPAVVLGRPALVSFAALPGERFAAVVHSVNPAVDAATRSVRVSLHVSDPRHRVLPGMHAVASIDGAPLGQRVLIPRAAVIEREQRTLVFTYDARGGGAGRARWRYVALGAGSDSLVEVTDAGAGEPLLPGDSVLVDGHATLTHDALVRPVVLARQTGAPDE